MKHLAVAAGLATMVAVGSGAAALAAPSLSQTKAYISQKSAISWQKRSDGVEISQSVTFPAKCTMVITHHYDSLRSPGTPVADLKFTIEVTDVYKLIAWGKGVAIRTKAKDIIQQDRYHPANWKHKKFCPAGSEWCENKPWAKDTAYLTVVDPKDMYKEKVGKALRRMMELCGAGKEELF